MQIIFITARHRFPGASAKIGAVIARRFSVFSLYKIEIIRIRTVRIRKCFLEIFMLVGAVVYNQIHHDIHIPLFCFRQKFVKLFHRTELLRDLIIIRDIISLIHKRRFVDW